MEDKAWKIGEEEDKKVKASMEILLKCLRGEELGSSNDSSSEQSFIFCLHKVAVGSLAAVAIAFFVWCLLKYCHIGVLPGIVAGAVAVIGTVAVIALKIYQEGGISAYFDSLGIQEVPQLAIAGGVIVVLAVLAVGLWLLVRLVPALQTAARANLKTIVAAAGCGLFALVAIFGAAAGILLGDEDDR